MDHHVVGVDGHPASGGEVGREEHLFAAEEEARLEAADREDGFAADHRCAGEEAEESRIGHPGISHKRTACHEKTGRIQTRLGTHEHAPTHDRHARMRVETRRCAREPLGRPPGVVIRERHVRCPRTAHTEVATGRAGYGDAFTPEVYWALR